MRVPSGHRRRDGTPSMKGTRMKIRAAVAWEAGAALSVEEFELDGPRHDEILVKVGADGSPRARQNGKPVRAAFFGQSSFATHSLVTERNIVPVAPDAPLHYLAGFTCGVQTGAGAILNAMPVGPASKVAIWGTGAVG